MTGAVTSPTFVIARVHQPDRAAGGKIPLVHVDAYRLGGGADPRAEIDDLDLDAALEESVVVVEWGEGVVSTWPTRTCWCGSTRPAARTPPGRTSPDKWS